MVGRARHDEHPATLGDGTLGGRRADAGRAGDEDRPAIEAAHQVVHPSATSTARAVSRSVTSRRTTPLRSAARMALALAVPTATATTRRVARSASMSMATARWRSPVSRNRPSASNGWTTRSPTAPRASELVDLGRGQRAAAEEGRRRRAAPTRCGHRPDPDDGEGQVAIAVDRPSDLGIGHQRVAHGGVGHERRGIERVIQPAEPIGEGPGQRPGVLVAPELPGAAGELHDLDGRARPARDLAHHRGHGRAPGDPDDLRRPDQAIDHGAGEPGDRIEGRRVRRDVGHGRQVEPEPLLERRGQRPVLDRRVAVLDADAAVGQGGVDQPGDAEPGDPEMGRDLDLGHLAVEEQAGDLGAQVGQGRRGGGHAPIVDRLLT